VTARIFLKFILAVSLVMAVALSTIDYLAAGLAERAYVDGLVLSLTQKAQMLSVLSRSSLTRLRADQVHSLASAAAARLTLIGRDGRVLADSENDPARMESHLNRAEVQEALQGRTGVSRRPSPTMGAEFLYVAVPVSVGAIRLAMPMPAIRGQINQLRWRLLGLTALAFLPAIFLAAIFARRFSTRLGAIIDFASTLATGNFRARLDRPGRDELGVLARQLNETGSKLRKMFAELEREHLELERLERVRKDFVVNVSHELRTPLASIQGYTETLLEGAIHDDRHNVRFLQIIRQNAERLTRLTADLLTLSRVEVRRQRFRFASYQAAVLLSSCCDSLRPVAGRKRITIEREPVAEDLEVFCDFEAAHQILTNLLDNAIKYTAEDGRITVSARRLPLQAGRAEVAEISVTDTGIGIPPAELPRLFERFYRVDKARSRDLGGTGLGLAIVKHLTRSMGGEVRVESVHGRGSTFSFTLTTQDAGQAEDEKLQSEFTVL
jgi:two-component system phosphate regulon sensor histidine kinase PhoR